MADDEVSVGAHLKRGAPVRTPERQGKAAMTREVKALASLRGGAGRDCRRRPGPETRDGQEADGMGVGAGAG